MGVCVGVRTVGVRIGVRVSMGEVRGVGSRAETWAGDKAGTRVEAEEVGWKRMKVEEEGMLADGVFVFPEGRGLLSSSFFPGSTSLSLDSAGFSTSLLLDPCFSNPAGLSSSTLPDS